MMDREIGEKAKDLLNKDNSSDHKFTSASLSASGEGSTSTAMRKGNVSALDIGSRSKYKNAILDVKADTDLMDLVERAPHSSTSLSGKITPTPLTGINELDATTACDKTPRIQPQSNCPDSMADTVKGISMSCQVREHPLVDMMDKPMTEAEVVFYTTLLLMYHDIKRWLPSLTISDEKTPQMEQAPDSDGLVDDNIGPEVQEESFDVLLRGLLSDLRLTAQLGESVDSDITAEDGCDSTNQKKPSSAEWILAKKLEEFFLPILRKYKGTQSGSSSSPSGGIADVAQGDERVYDFFASELAEMEEMGFSDVMSNMIALMECAFDVEKAVVWLLKFFNPHVMM